MDTTTKIPSDEKERMELHRAYKETLKELLLRFYGDCIEEMLASVHGESSRAVFDRWQAIIDKWVEQSFKPEPNPDCREDAKNN